MEIRQRPLEEINAAAQVDLMPDQILEPSFFPGFQQQRHQHIADGM